MSETVIEITRLRRPVGGVHRAPIGRADMVLRGTIDELEAIRMVRVDVRDLDLARMQEAEMRGVDIAFQCLQPIASALPATEVRLVRRAERCLERAGVARLRARPYRRRPARFAPP